MQLLSEFLEFVVQLLILVDHLMGEALHFWHLAFFQRHFRAFDLEYALLRGLFQESVDGDRVSHRTAKA
ncbi:hypothetical protein D3C71_2072230 [compost metagenome]